MLINSYIFRVCNLTFNFIYMQGQKLEELLKQSDYISQVLDYLKARLSRQQQQKDSLSQHAIDFIQKAIDLKMSFRLLADGIETNRTLVQVQKQQIQKKKAFLEGLQYYKATLKTKIGHSKLDSIDMKDYIQEEPSPETDWMQDYERQEQKVMNRLEQFKNKKHGYEQSQLRREQLTKMIKSSQQKYRKTFPQQVKKLYSQVCETGKIFNIQEVDNLQLSGFKSNKIQLIHSLLYPLKLKGLINVKHSNQFDTEQLQITIQKGFSSQYEYARQNKIMVEQKPFKFFIASIIKQSQHDNQPVLAISISRRQAFTSEQIFNNLFLQQKVKQIYLNPKSEVERNTNNKYSRLDWISQILASTSNLISGGQLIQKIKNRLFSLSLIRHALENISKRVPSYYFPVFKHTQAGARLSHFPTLQAKRISMGKCQKSNFQQYRKQTHIPQWVIKALNNYQILKEQHNSPLESLECLDRYPLDTFICKNNLQQLETKDFYSYYKFQFVAEKNVISGFFLIPTDYPHRPSVIRLLNFKKVVQPPQSTLLPKQIHFTLQNEGLQMKNRLFSDQLPSLQAELNQKINYFLFKLDKNGLNTQQKCKKKQPFLIYFQINRLFSLFIEQSIQNQK